MARKIKVKVTKKDIANGKRSKCTKCPIALAIRRVQGCSTYMVSSYSIYNRSYEYLCNLPKKAANFVSQFDDGNKVKPFSFTVEL